MLYSSNVTFLRCSVFMLLALPDLWASSTVTNPLDLECWESINTFNTLFTSPCKLKCFVKSGYDENEKFSYSCPCFNSCKYLLILFRYWDPYYYRRPRMRTDNDGMKFIESVSGLRWMLLSVLMVAFVFQNKSYSMSECFVGFLICIWGW